MPPVRAPNLDDVKAGLAASLPGAYLARRLSDETEAAVADAFSQARLQDGICILAQGGLARRELAPRADVDLIVVLAERDEVHERAAQRALYPLWDAGYVLGHAVATPSEALARATDDQHAATALLEARVVAGDRALGDGLLAAFRRDLLPQLRSELAQQKLDELTARRARFGGSIHLVEPNVKSSPGGLRDLQAVLWLGLLRAGPVSPNRDALARLLEVGLLYDREAAALRTARDTALALRIGLHAVTGREEDRLLFQHQTTLAELMRVEGDDDLTSTEMLMRRWFRSASLMRRTVDDVIARLGRKEGDALGSGPAVREIEPGILRTGRQVFVRPAERLATEPGLLVDVVRVASEQGLELSARTRGRLYEARENHGDLSEDAQSSRALLRLCKSDAVQGNPFATLLDAGVLGTIMRDIARLDGRFKQDGYHAYTTDAHICRCVDMALRVASGAESVPAPLQGSFDRTTRYHLLVLGMLFHDIGKGLPDDHSDAGSQIAAAETARMGLSSGERDLVRFLVEDHLTLSFASQRRDLSDPAVVEQLARRARTVERLDLLALLTWVDIACVAPGMFTDWKGRLLGLAVDRVRGYLLEPSQGASVRGEHAEQVRRAARTLLEGKAPPEVIERFVDGAAARALASRLDGGLARDLGAFAQYDPEAATPVVLATRTEGGHAHTLRVVCRDRVGLLGDLAAALASHGANVLHAHADSRDDGTGIDVFRVDDGEGRSLEQTTLADVTGALRAAAAGEPPGQVAGRARRRAGPAIAPRVRVVGGVDSWGATIFEVRCTDRTGLIADVARTFARFGWTIVLAKINTDGANVHDTFYATHADDDDTSDTAPVVEALLQCLEVS